MKRIVISSILAISTMPTLAATTDLGRIGLNEMKEIESCSSGDGQFSRISVQARRGSGELDNIIVVFGDNSVQNIETRDQFLSEGQNIGPFHLGRARCIKSIILLSDDSRSRMELNLTGHIIRDPRPTPPGPRPDPRPQPPRHDEIIRPGDQVVEKVNDWSIQTVQYVTESGTYGLSNGSTYQRSQLSKLVGTFDFISESQEVLEKVNDWSLQRVSKVSADGDFLLANGSWYRRDQITELVSSYQQFALGQEIVEKVNDWSLQRISRISATGDFLLANGSWYQANQVFALVPYLDGISVGDRVRETVNAPSIQTVSKITEDGSYLLSNGSWYQRANLERIFQ